MKNFLKMLGTGAFLCLLLAVPGVAQIANGLDFTTTFPFWAGTAKLPPGTYTVSQSDQTQNILKLASKDGKHTVMVEFMATQAEDAHAATDVSFHRYGTAEYLTLIWVGGQKYGMKLEPTKAEKKAAAAAKPETHSVSGTAK